MAVARQRSSKSASGGELPHRVDGFQASGVACGLKANGLDLALIASDTPAAAAGVFTRSTVPGAPVVISRERVQLGHARGVVANSGCANVALGKRGLQDAQQMAALAAKSIGCRPEEILVASTGVIGEPLPMERLREGIPQATSLLSEGGLSAAGEAILTTDMVAKSAVERVVLDGRSVTIAGIAKGSGMIEPNMATMLAFLLTDAVATPAFLRRCLRDAAEQSFNRVTVDGEGSTSDMALLLASGRAGNMRLTQGAWGKSAAAKDFANALERVCVTLAKAIAVDGEGATKLVEVRVSGAVDAAEAELAARRVANSLLVKTAIFGGDPNWGRILQTIGAGGVHLSLERTEVRLAGVPVFRRGASLGPEARKQAEAALASSAEVEIVVELGAGSAEARIWTCDLSYDYVRINAEYTT